MGVESRRARHLDLFRDCNPVCYWAHGIAHFHAEYQGQQATFTFDGKILAGTLRSRTARRLIEEWAMSHREELEANWLV